MQLHMRDHLVNQVKQMALQKGFRVKKVYADRVDRGKTRSIHFYCFKHRSALRQLATERAEGCGFRLMYKLKAPEYLKLDEDVFTVFKLYEMHNHPLGTE